MLTQIACIRDNTPSHTFHFDIWKVEPVQPDGGKFLLVDKLNETYSTWPTGDSVKLAVSLEYDLQEVDDEVQLELDRLYALGQDRDRNEE